MDGGGPRVFGGLGKIRRFFLGTRRGRQTSRPIFNLLSGPGVCLSAFFSELSNPGGRTGGVSSRARPRPSRPEFFYGIRKINFRMLHERMGKLNRRHLARVTGQGNFSFSRDTLHPSSSWSEAQSGDAGKRKKKEMLKKDPVNSDPANSFLRYRTRAGIKCARHRRGDRADIIRFYEEAST